MTIGPDGKSNVREFDNVKSPLQGVSFLKTTPMISSEREPLADVTTTDKVVKVVMEMPGVNKENIKISICDSSVEYQLLKVPRENIMKLLNCHKKQILKLLE